MKNKLTFKTLSRWVATPLLVASLFAWGVSPAYSGTASKVLTQKMTAVSQTATDNTKGVDEVKAQLKEFESKQKELYSLELEGQRKKVDWWLNWVAIFLTAVAILLPIAGIAIPYFMASKGKDAIEKDMQEIRASKNVIELEKTKIEQIKDEVAKLLVSAKFDADEAHKHKESAATSLALLQSYENRPDSLNATESKADVAHNSAITTAVTAVKEDKTADPILRFRAEAIAASEAKDAEKAYSLWNALVQLNKEDGSAQFNAGYWAGCLSLKQEGVEKLHWLKLVQRHCEQALRIKPNSYDSAYNWGLALSSEASVFSASELTVARSLWQQAVEKYQQALIINPEMHEAANNWGSLLAEEARALVASDPEAARSLWQQAGEKFQLGLSIKPDKHKAADNWGSALLHEAGAIALSDPEQSSALLNQAEKMLLAHADAAPSVVSYNLACIYGRRGDVPRCLHWLSIPKTEKELPDCAHLSSDKDLDPVRNTPEFNAWFASVCGSTGSPRTVKEN
jgi:Plant specific mitochondrial import receptor subunit TOM20